MKKYVFTISTGRCGTGSMADFLRNNVKNCVAYHERLDKANGFAYMNEFNEKGNTKNVKNYWKKRFKNMKKENEYCYVETAHQNMKAGLFENIHLLKGDITILFMRRHPQRIAESFVRRGSFDNELHMRNWLLVPTSPNNLIKESPSGKMETARWYVEECCARGEKYKDEHPEFNWIDMNIETLNNESNAKVFLRKLKVDLNPLFTPMKKLNATII